MAARPYLHPSQRNLKSEQVGPSSHTNEYHVGVLQGNWVEERRAIVQNPVDTKLDSMTVSRASYQKPRAGEVVKTKPVSQNETPRNLLFGHGTDKIGDAGQRSALVEKKRADWNNENDPEASMYHTTSGSTFRQ
eukprot:TRINITY_DN8696_c0_g4_i1.p2 TRINITY_DN8696_c0_g4~~TRINITY_DN8696_c0_g4_i1.p2  ORF type:complete len:134 (+),score=59.62 TRINITY_DN8696_c0_g4_i1:91-492(+)